MPARSPTLQARTGTLVGAPTARALGDATGGDPTTGAFVASGAHPRPEPSRVERALAQTRDDHPATDPASSSPRLTTRGHRRP
jgi:hypothetical protein